MTDLITSARNGDIDAQLLSIRNGLTALSKLIEEPGAQEAFDVTHSVEVARTLDMLRRLQHSLRQYAERGRDLFYIAFVGHFSSGKSSTINSIFRLWKTPQERHVALNPTDTAVTLLTDARNEHSVLGVSREGIVPIRTRYVDLEQFANLVIADTPGTGDPEEIQEIARQFLPVCDLVLFFFSAASPFDVSDLPLLTELRNNLPFIPIRFVVTRADEFRKLRHDPLNTSNFNDEIARAFIADVAGRLNKAAGFGLGLEPSDFFLIDNVEQFQIEALRSFLSAKADQKHIEARIQMHSHKVQFFRNSASKCLEVLRERLSTQFQDIDRIVTTARKNVERFEQCITPSTLTILKRWAEELQRLGNARTSDLATIQAMKTLPLRVRDLPQSIESIQRFQGHCQRDARIKAARIAKQCATETSSQVNVYLAKLQQRIANLDIRGTDQLVGIASQTASLRINLEPEDLQPQSIGEWIEEVRQDCARAIDSVCSDTKDGCERLERRIAGGTFAKSAQGVLEIASEVLGLELDKYFEIVLIYHGSVFARHVKEAIARAGLGRRLDELEHEMSTEQREAIKSVALVKLIGAFDDGLVQFRSDVISFAARASELRSKTVDLRFSHTQTVQDEFASNASFDAERGRLSEELSAKVAGNVEAFAAAVGTEFDSALMEARGKYEDEKRELSSTRRKRFAYLMIGGTVLGLGGFLLYTHFEDAANQALGKMIFYGAVSSVVGNLAGFITAKVTGGFSKLFKSTAAQNSTALRQRLSGICNIQKETHQPVKINEEEIAQRLSNQMIKSLSECLDADTRSFGTAELESLNLIRAEHEGIRSAYSTSMGSLVQNATFCLGQPQVAITGLEQIATEIRDREISPSFDVLDETREKYRGVQERLDAITFG